jgi:hypothetical protein
LAEVGRWKLHTLPLTGVYCEYSPEALRIFTK